MANYKQTSATGETYQRAFRVSIENRLGSVPSITFQEETVISIGSTVMRAEADSCMLMFNPATEFEILNPDTNLPTGNMTTHAAVYAQLYSLYIIAAEARDAARAAMIAQAAEQAANMAAANQP